MIAIAGPRMAAAKGSVNCQLKFLDIGSRVFIEDDQIDGKLFVAPVFMRLKQTANLSDIGGIVDAQQYNRQVARDRQWPKPRLTPGTACQHFARWPETGIVIKDWCRKALEIGGFAR